MRQRERRHRQIGDVWFYVAGAVFVAAAVYMVALGISGADLIKLRHDALPALVAVLAAGLGALRGWWHDRKAAEGLAEAAQEREGLREELAEERRRHEEDVREQKRVRGMLERARQAEKEWNRELRTQVIRMQRDRGALGDPRDIPDLVLQTAMALLESAKGLLLSRTDGNGDGALDLLAARGFDNDPKNSSLAQRFADEVIEKDTTVREADLEHQGAGSADDEIDSLVAIPIYLHDEFSGVVVCANSPNGFEDYEEEVLLALGDHAGAVLHNARLQGDLRSAYIATVRMLAEAIDAKDPFLRGHSNEVSEYVAAVADRLGLDGQQREELIFGSLLHDVGKIGISERILLKPDRLTDEEYSIVKLHPRIGCRIIEQVPALRELAPAILHHHERFDGRGYPAGLRGEDIPIEARIICVADSFSAMTAQRPYRDRMSLEEACEELERCAGEQFDPEIVRIFVEEVRKRPEPTSGDLAAALDDPELQSRRAEGEPLLGHGSLAIVDNLTLLYTHRYFHEVAHAEAERAGLQDLPFSVLMVELSGIGEVNTSEGYAAGDATIQKVARALQRAAVRHGGTACRYSGRRLGLIVPRCDGEVAERVAGELSGSLDGGPTIRTGTATWQPGDSGEDVVERALAAAREGVLSAWSSGPPETE